MRNAGLGRLTCVPRSRTVADVTFATACGTRTQRPLVIAGSVGIDTVDIVARLHLRARRLGLTMTMHGAQPDLELLLVLVGLKAVLEADSQSR